MSDYHKRRFVYRQLMGYSDDMRNFRLQGVQHFISVMIDNWGPAMEREYSSYKAFRNVRAAGVRLARRIFDFFSK